MGSEGRAMNQMINTKSIGKGIADVPEYFVLCETPMSRLIFHAQIHDSGIRGKIIRQRRESDHDIWSDEKAIPIRTLGKNETINIEVTTEAVSKLYAAINQLADILKQRGVEYGEHSYAVVDPKQAIITDANKTQIINKLLEKGYSEDFWNGLVDQSPDLATKLSMARVQIVRNKALIIFEQNMEEDKFTEYKQDIGKSASKDETVWQLFFKENEWIFGYGLDYRFYSILQREFHASDTEANGSDGVIVDYLLGDKKFTTFVELKLPETPLFGKSKNRSGCWRLSDELCEAVSQLLEQKASGVLKIETSKTLYDENRQQIKQHAYNSKVILIIGNWSQLENDEPKVRELKEKTFELYRRELKNIEIITYDELLERAKFIVRNK